MQIDPPSSEEAERRAFLSEVEALLPTTGIVWSSLEYRSISPFGNVGLVLTVPGIPGEACVIAISLGCRQTIDDTTFPGSREPYYQLLIKSGSGYLSEHFMEQCVSRDPQDIATALRVWAQLGQGLQRPALPALRDQDLGPLRRLAALRASIAQLAQQATARDVAPYSEEMERAVGLVRAGNFSSLVQGFTPAFQAILADDLQHLAPDDALPA